MLFKDIIGQNELKRRLIQTVKDKRISHAQLFVGSEGSGNLALALAYAQYICCQNRSDEDSCGQCKSCLQFQKLVHPDMHFAFPVNTNEKVKKDPTSTNFMPQWRQMIINSPYFSENDWYEKIEIENKQGIIGKLEAELIQQKLSFKPYESEYKFMLIWMPERMNDSAANKLLKLIEEPPANTVFLLVSKNINQIIKTILSRTQTVRVPPIDEQSMNQALSQKYELTPHELQVLTHLAAGDMLRATKIHERHETEQDFFDNFKNIMRIAYQQNFVEILNWAENMGRLGRERQKSFLFYAQQMIRENFILNRNMQSLNYATDEEVDFAKQFSRFITPNNIEEFYSSINLAMAHLEQNGNQKIIFADLAIIFARLLRKG